MQEVDDYGNTVQETVDKAVVNIKESLSRLERKGRAGSLIEEVSLHTLEPASMTRQVWYNCMCRKIYFHYLFLYTVKTTILRKVLVVVRLSLKRSGWNIVMMHSKESHNFSYRVQKNY